MRVAFEVMTVLEGAGLALVGIDSHVAWCRKAPDDLPLAARGEAGAAEAPEAGVRDRRDDVLEPLRMGTNRLQKLVSARRAIGGEAYGERREPVLAQAGLQRRDDRLRRGVSDRMAGHHRNRRLGAATHTGNGLDADRRALGAVDQVRQQRLRAGDPAWQGIADADSHRGRGGVALLHDVEVVVEARHLEDLGLPHPQQIRQRPHVAGGEMAMAVLELMQMFDQPVALRGFAGQRHHLRQRIVIERASAGLRGGLAPAGPAGVRPGLRCPSVFPG